MKRSKSNISIAFNSRTKLQRRSQPSNKPSTRGISRPVTREIHRDSKKQLKVSRGGIPYEKPKSRRVRQKVALAHSGNPESAVALGVGRNKTRTSVFDNRDRDDAWAAVKITPTLDMEAYNDQLKNKAFVRGAKIAHKLKTQQLDQLNNKAFVRGAKIAHKLKTQQWQAQRNEQEQPSTTSVSSAVASTSKVIWRPKREEDQKLIIPNRSQCKSQPDSKSNSESRTRTEPAVAHTKKRKIMREREENQQRTIPNQSQGNSQSDRELQRHRKSKQKQRNLQREEQKQVKQQQPSPNVAKSAVLTAKPPPVVIDLVSSDSENDSDGDSSENDLLLTLTQFLKDEAIGRDANRNEMKVYAQHLFRLGLHSREMILDALDFNATCTTTDTDTASGIVEKWEWMKPFHKTVFYRWVWFERQRQRKEIL